MASIAFALETKVDELTYNQSANIDFDDGNVLQFVGSETVETTDAFTPPPTREPTDEPTQAPAAAPSAGGGGSRTTSGSRTTEGLATVESVATTTAISTATLLSFTALWW